MVHFHFSLPNDARSVAETKSKQKGTHEAPHGIAYLQSGCAWASWGSRRVGVVQVYEQSERGQGSGRGLHFTKWSSIFEGDWRMREHLGHVRSASGAWGDNGLQPRVLKC